MKFLNMAATRIGVAALTLLMVSLLIFGVIHLVPGSFELLAAGNGGTAASRSYIAEALGIDKPLPEQYVHWMGNLLKGDLGDSLISGFPIRDEFVRRAPLTLQLDLMATGIASVFGVIFGVYGAIAPPKQRARAFTRIFSAFGMGVPNFVTGSVLVYFFSKYNLGLQVGGYVPFTENPIQNLQSMLLPALTLSVFGIAVVTRTTHDAVLEVLGRPYIVAALARGENRRQIVFRHILRNAAIPIVTIVIYLFADLLGGALVVETLFSLPGFGSFTYTAIQVRDYGIVEASVLFASTGFITLNLIADLLYGLIDPRIASSSG